MGNYSVEKKDYGFPKEIQSKKRRFKSFPFNGLLTYLMKINSKINNLLYHVGNSYKKLYQFLHLD